MPSTRTRRSVLSTLGVGVSALVSGCLTNTDPETPAGDQTASPSATDTETETRGSPGVSDAAAKERALAAEEAYLERQFSNASCLSNWGTAPTTTNEQATVLERSDDGVRVEVTHPFSYTETRTEVGSNRSVQSHADGGSTAQYLVTEAAVERLEGDRVSPC